MSKLIGSYKNGNYMVNIYDDGTKIRENDLDFFRADTVESMDIKICNKCDLGCPQCHENSTPDGKCGDIMSESFIDKLHPYTELAIGGGNPLEHPDLVSFLEKCKRLQLIPSMTVNQKHFMKSLLVDALYLNQLIYGLGVSLNSVNVDFIRRLKLFPNAVIHVINGLVSVEDLAKLRGYGFKILILGYKEFRRGLDHYSVASGLIEKKKQELYDMLPTIIEENWFKVVSFDNLAIKQLDAQRLMSAEDWDQFYMGDDGQDGNMTSASMYVDMVNREFAKNSTSTERYPLEDDIVTMFSKLRNK